ncbi:MAG TPA: methyltransferase domain-containing protein [Burkholderiales bacterium]|jgi:cyclopropane fatty-acyl-phospholipid synthase-like methyltransferase|nr:methyltransferase domain-containing protein [Burkholderiales bacterium]
MAADDNQVVAFYNRHPISQEQILASLAATRGHLEHLAPEDLFPYDQDHYGGLDAVDALADCAAIGPGKQVADFCAGLAGPARYLASEYGATVTCLELNPRRAPGAADLTRRVGLNRQVRIVRADVTRAPLADETMDAIISQEALLHVADKRGALAQAYRVLKKGGRLAFTDWIEHRRLDATDSETMWRGIAAQTLQSFDSYVCMLQDLGFRSISSKDLTAEWTGILEQRFAMYRKLREQTIRLGTPSGDEEFYRSYARLVALMHARTLGGGRFVAEK